MKGDESINGKTEGFDEKTGSVAEQQTIVRNGKKALSQQGRWVEMDFMVQLQSNVEKEEWARLQLNAGLVSVILCNFVKY